MMSFLRETHTFIEVNFYKGQNCLSLLMYIYIKKQNRLFFACQKSCDNILYYVYLEQPEDIKNDNSFVLFKKWFIIAEGLLLLFFLHRDLESMRGFLQIVPVDLCLWSKDTSLIWIQNYINNPRILVYSGSNTDYDAKGALLNCIH